MYKFLFLFIFVINFTTSVYASLNILRALPDLGEVVTDPKFNVLGAPAFEVYLKGIRYYGYYGPINHENTNPLLKCIVKNIRNQDFDPNNNQNVPEFEPDNCPQDVVTALIQWLFPNAAMDGNFIPNRRNESFRDVVSRFTPTTIGAIIAEIYKAKGNYNEKLIENIANSIVEKYKIQKIQSKLGKKSTAKEKPTISIEEQEKNLKEKYNKLAQAAYNELKTKNKYNNLDEILEYLRDFNKLSKKERKEYLKKQ